MRSNQTPFMNKEFWTPLNYTTRLEIRFLKIKQNKAGKAIIRKKYARNPIEKTSDCFKYLHEKKVCDKKKWKEENPILQIMPFQMKKLAAIDNKII